MANLPGGSSLVVASDSNYNNITMSLAGIDTGLRK